MDPTPERAQESVVPGAYCVLCRAQLTCSATGYVNHTCSRRTTAETRAANENDPELPSIARAAESYRTEPYRLDEGLARLNESESEQDYDDADGRWLFGAD